MKDITLVLLPGLDGTGKLFKPLVQHLPSWIKPVVVSYPGDKPYGYEELKKIVAGALPQNEDCVILGESFSGPLAIMCAAEKPDGLLGAILCATFARNPFRIVPSWVACLSISRIYSLWPTVIRFRSLFAGRKYIGLINAALDAIKTVMPKAISARIKAILRINVLHLFDTIDVSVLYMTSRKDNLIKKHNVAELKNIKPEMKVVEINTQHFLLQLEPERSAQIIKDFIESISKPVD